MLEFSTSVTQCRTLNPKCAYRVLLWHTASVRQSSPTPLSRTSGDCHTSSLCAVMFKGVTQSLPSMLTAPNLPSSSPLASHTTSVSTHWYFFSLFFSATSIAVFMMVAVCIALAVSTTCWLQHARMWHIQQWLR
eukprot:GHRR01031672.1.p1 GENE.GHRR01031672.1~~GHRR01031672.1.p1  ORF type:complete len:134 (+),score=24.29 GHRR01031672.1:896-1297(+)